MRSRLIVLAILAALLTSPLSVAWGGKGSHEPSTAKDRDDGFMFPSPDTSTSGSKIYFNGFFTQCYASSCPRGIQGVDGHFINPNSGNLQTGIGSTYMYHHALLGVWKDCNNDGFIGLGDSGVFEYRAELLVDPATGKDPGICNAESLPLNSRGQVSYPRGWKPVHHDGTWVHEFLPIVWEDHRDGVDPNPWNIGDNSSRVWADRGTPDSVTGQRRCWTNPQPYGTYRSTGGLIEYADCHLDWRLTSTLSAIGSQTNRPDLTFDDKPRDQSESSSTLNQRNPWGHQKDDSYAQVWDCSADQVFVTRDPTDPGDGSGDLHGVGVPNPGNGGTIWFNLTNDEGFFEPLGVLRIDLNVSSPSPGAPNGGGSIAGTINETEQGFEECDRNEPHKFVVSVGPGYSNGDAPYLNENAGLVNSEKRRENDFPMLVDQRGRGKTHPLGPGTPLDYGQRQVSTEGIWTTTNRVDNINPYVNPDEAGPRTPFSHTYYAYVSPAIVQSYGLTLPGADGVYGSEACALPEPTFFCQRAEWWKDANGADAPPRSCALGVVEEDREKPAAERRCIPIGAYVGDPYNLRDVDCHDASVGGLREQGFHWGTVTGTDC